jgi:hypothetical protein
MKEVTSYEHHFEIRDGRRIWLSEPPVDVKSDIFHDAVRLRHWPQLLASLDR